jgi:hypothetical protein
MANITTQELEDLIVEELSPDLGGEQEVYNAVLNNGGTEEQASSIVLNLLGTHYSGN